MSKHLIDTPPRLAECNRCGAYVLAGMSAGLKYVVDTSPLNPAVARALIISGIKVYYGEHDRLGLLTAHTMAHSGPRYQAHACGCSALDASAFEVPPVPPLQAPALEPGVSDVLVGQGMTYSVVQDVRPHRSDVVRCTQCGVLMDHEDMIMIEIPVWQINTGKFKDPANKRRKIERTFEGWGSERWAIHPSCAQG